MQEIIFIIHVLSALSLIALVLVQHGKGADMGAGFGGGASQTMFGSLGSMPFLIKVTGVIAIIFFATSLTLGYLTAKHARQPVALPIPAVPMQQVPAQTSVPVTTPTPVQSTLPASHPQIPAKQIPAVPKSVPSKK